MSQTITESAPAFPGSYAAPASAAPVTRFRSRSGDARLNLGHIIASELYKAKALPSTWWCAAITVVLAVLVAVSAASSMPEAYAQSFMSMNNQILSMIAVTFPGVAGCLLASVEYSSGAIRSSLAAAPRRMQWMGGKTIAAVIVLAGSQLLALLANLTVSWLILTMRGITLSVTGFEVAAMSSFIAVAVFVGLMGFGFAILTRSAAAAITIGFVLILILPMTFQILANFLPTFNDLMAFLPMPAMTNMSDFAASDPAMANTDPDATPVSFWWTQTGGLVVSLIWVALSLGSAAVLLQRRDA
ncbi:MAG: ABC transporter permease [Propionibacteriaceae bacterium]|jgi:ABC-2 type transport system permease protein|nr:ABC transporter permease [Propionibacteriaceae bacterium]